MSKKQKRKNTREPLEYDLPFESEEYVEEPRSKYKFTLAYLIDQDEVNALIAASTSPYVEPPSNIVNTEYSTYTQAEVNALLNNDFAPKNKKKK